MLPPRGTVSLKRWEWDGSIQRHSPHYFSLPKEQLLRGQTRVVRFICISLGIICLLFPNNSPPSLQESWAVGSEWGNEECRPLSGPPSGARTV